MISLVAVEQGDAIADWEYFTYRTGLPGQDCEPCPSGFLRLIGIRDVDDGITPPAGSEFIDGFIAFLTFRIARNRDYLGMCPRIGFCSIACGDNIITDVAGDEIALAFPEQNGAEGHLVLEDPNYDLAACLADYQGESAAESFVYFDPGYICVFGMDDVGDINLNGIEYEIGDATLFSSYFIYGPSVWDPIYYENQILGTDINDDGQTLTIADLVTLTSIIAHGSPVSCQCCFDMNKYHGDDPTAYLAYSFDHGLSVSASSPVDIGGAAFVFQYDGMEPGEAVLSADSSPMTIGSSARDGLLRVLVYSLEGRSLHAGQFDMFTVPVSGAGTMALVEAQFSDAHGNMLDVVTNEVSPATGYELFQNFPNPFNAATRIHFTLPTTSDWTLGIYNIIGQKIEEFAGSNDAGQVDVVWRAENIPSGMYFYKLEAGQFTATRKMVLTK